MVLKPFTRLKAKHIHSGLQHVVIDREVAFHLAFHYLWLIKGQAPAHTSPLPMPFPAVAVAARIFAAMDDYAVLRVSKDRASFFDRRGLGFTVEREATRSFDVVRAEAMFKPLASIVVPARALLDHCANFRVFAPFDQAGLRFSVNAECLRLTTTQIWRKPVPHTGVGWATIEGGRAGCADCEAATPPTPEGVANPQAAEDAITVNFAALWPALEILDENAPVTVEIASSGVNRGLRLRQTAGGKQLMLHYGEYRDLDIRDFKRELAAARKRHNW